MIPNKHHGRKAREYHRQQFKRPAKTVADLMAKYEKLQFAMENQSGITDMMRGSGSNYSNIP